MFRCAVNVALLAERPIRGWERSVTDDLVPLLHASVLSRGADRLLSDRSDSIIGYSMIELLAAECADTGRRSRPSVRSLPGGAPAFVGAGQCSLSHSDGLVAAIFSHRAVGIDVVGWSELHPDDYHAMFTANELAVIRDAANPCQRAALLWGMKESFAKAVQTGLTDDLLEHDFSSCVHSGLMPNTPFRFLERRVGRRSVVLCSISPGTAWNWIDVFALRDRLWRNDPGGISANQRY